MMMGSCKLQRVLRRLDGLMEQASEILINIQTYKRNQYNRYVIISRYYML